MDIGENMGWGVVGRDNSEEFWLGVGNKVDFKNESIVSKGIKCEFGVRFGGSLGVLKWCWWWI